MVHALWPETKSHGSYPSFLANSGEEALSGAVKLARYTQHQRAEKKPLSGDALKQSTRVLLVDDGNWFDDFAWITFDEPASKTPSNECRVEFIPDVVSLTTSEFVTLCESQESFTGIVVLSPTATRGEARYDVQPDVMRTAMRKYLASEAGVLITCMNAERFLAGPQVEEAALMPDIVVFDETFTMRQVPFGAFAARPDLYAQWTAKGMSTFHSTTYQPNTISTMHFLKCLDERSPGFFQRLQPLLKPLLVNNELRRRTFRDLFNPALMRLISATGFDGEDVTVSGHYVRVDNQRYFDGIGGVACSLRGHNPESWVSEIEALHSISDVCGEVARRLYSLTGLRHHVPAVSGGSAVEHALKLSLLAQSPKSFIVALKGGFGGKTLLALSGTSKPSYKKGLDPLYPDVLYVDPFAPDAIRQLEQIVKTVPVAVIQLELIQGVGGVREIPQALLEYLQIARREAGVLLFVDEIQTGMFRTGPFVRSSELSISPDLMTIGKGTSDMMFPFAMTLYSDRVNYLL
ncbi:MAG: aminotransferase class III-fold pyridoxal phosphate-dependent enzyme, partial [Fuerstia sp.]|nr:aminotransferase class III-fold pyridoxal phosphate-dependent enzyme [Fuerstiella sp.]